MVAVWQLVPCWAALLVVIPETSAAAVDQVTSGDTVSDVQSTPEPTTSMHPVRRFFRHFFSPETLEGLAATLRSIRKKLRQITSGEGSGSGESWQQRLLKIWTSKTGPLKERLMKTLKEGVISRVAKLPERIKEVQEVERSTAIPEIIDGDIQDQKTTEQKVKELRTSPELTKSSKKGGMNMISGNDESKEHDELNMIAGLLDEIESNELISNTENFDNNRDNQMDLIQNDMDSDEEAGSAPGLIKGSEVHRRTSKLVEPPSREGEMNMITDSMKQYRFKTMSGAMDRVDEKEVPSIPEGTEIISEEKIADPVAPSVTSHYSSSQMNKGWSHGSKTFLQLPSSNEIKKYVYYRIPSRTVLQVPVTAKTAFAQVFKASSANEPSSRAVPLAEGQDGKDDYPTKQLEEGEGQGSAAGVEKLGSNTEIKSEMKERNIPHKKTGKLAMTEVVSSRETSDTLQHRNKIHKGVVFSKAPNVSKFLKLNHAKDDLNSKSLESTTVNKKLIPIQVRYLPEIGKFIVYKKLSNNEQSAGKVLTSQDVNVQNHEIIHSNQMRKLYAIDRKIKTLGSKFPVKDFRNNLIEPVNNENQFLVSQKYGKPYITVEGKVANHGKNNAVVLYKIPSVATVDNSDGVQQFQFIPSNMPYPGRGFVPTTSGNKQQKRVRIQVNRNSESRNYFYNQLGGTVFQNGGSGVVPLYIGQPIGFVNLQYNTRIQGYSGTPNQQRDLNVVREKLKMISNKFPVLNLPGLLRL